MPKKSTDRSLLIAESGSSKTHWRWIGVDGKTASVTTAGLNPLFWSSSEIQQEIKRQFPPALVRRIITSKTRINFYGASCSSPAHKKIVAQALNKVFKNCPTIVEHDALASARALFGNKSGIACILGTGSNSCYYDGKKILNTIGGYAFILGDEGGGAHLGLLLVKAWLNDELPATIRKTFNKEYHLTKAELFKEVYHGKSPSRYLAQYSPFIHRFSNHPYMRKMILQAFKDFLERTVCRHKGFRRRSIGFVGSVAFYYRPLLNAACRIKKIRIHSIIQSPIDQLVRYHLNAP